jgi:hypothetical protein
MNNILSNYPDIISVAIVPMVIAILVFAFPLLIQTITRIDDKYGSTKLIESFRKDWICKWYLSLLITSVATCIPWCLQLPRFWDFGIFNNVIDYSALILVCIGTIGLVIMTFLIVNLTYVYYCPDKLFKRLEKQHNRAKNQKLKALYFDAISNILFYSINKADELLARTSLEFYYDAFIGFRKEKEGQIIEYPQEYYDAVFEANELLCNRKKKTVSYFNDSTLFELFLDQYQKTVISPKTYSFLWRLIVQSILYDKEDFVLAYWRKAHQLFSLFMPKIYPDYDSTYRDVTNQAEIDKRENERKDFLEFHYALGGLLIYKGKYNTIKELMNFTQSQPPKYVLVPERMQQIIERYMQINEKEYLNPVYYEQKYWFPDIYGVNSDEVIRMWIKRYLSVLFIRQYTLHEYYVNSNLLTTPKPPKNLSELNRWKSELDGLEFYVNDYLSQKEVLKELGLEPFSNPNWFDENNKVKPAVLIEDFKKEIEESFDKIKTEQNIDPDKEKKFQEETIKHLKPVLAKYSKIFTNNQIGENYQSYYIDGQHYILEKAAFSNNQDVGYTNTDSITAESVVMQFQYYAINTFILIFPKKYLLAEKDIFLALDRLNIDSENFVVISIGLNIDYFSHLQIDGLNKENEKWYYNGMEIIEIKNYMNDLVTQSLFVLKKDDLPNMIFNEIDKQFVEKYNLKKIDNTFNIYTGLNDLNKAENEIIKKEAERQNNQVDLSTKVLACVDINVEIQCKQNTKCIQLKAFSPFDDRGTANNIFDVQSIW